MGTFDFNSFVDLSQLFDRKKGQIVPPQPKAAVILYTGKRARLEQASSRFADLQAYIPTIKPLFSTIALKKKAIAETTAFSPPAAVAVTAAFEAVAEEPKKRPILKLKTKVELPPVVATISRQSTVQDLAAAFKAEKALLEKKAARGLAETFATEEVGMERRRHPLSSKPWAELIAEAEAPKKSKNNFDLGAAFKMEMQAFMAQQAKAGDDIAPVRLKTAFEPKIMSPQPQMQRPTPAPTVVPFRRPSKERIFA